MDLSARRKEIVDELSKGVHQVTFTKLDGTERTISCTLDSAILPNLKDKDSAKPINENIITAYCVDKKEWRSFRVENVKSIEQSFWIF